MSEDDKKRRVIPVTEEELDVEKQRIKTGAVRVEKKVHERQEVIDEPLRETDVEVRRVPVDEFVDEAVGTHQEGETTIIPVYQEVLVTEKRLLLKEEIHITRHEQTRQQPQSVTLRNEEVTINTDDTSDETESSKRTQR